MSGTCPHWPQFQAAVGAATGSVHRVPDAGLRAYGEMVGILWRSGLYSAAVQVEQFWNRLLAAHSFSLYCGYAMDVFAEANGSALDAIVKAHTHLIPAERNGRLEVALHQAMDDTLGPEAQHWRSELGAKDQPMATVLPSAEAMTLWLRAHRPRRAKDVLDRARYRYAMLSGSAG